MLCENKTEYYTDRYGLPEIFITVRSFEEHNVSSTPPLPHFSYSLKRKEFTMRVAIGSLLEFINTVEGAIFPTFFAPVTKIQLDRITGEKLITVKFRGSGSESRFTVDELKSRTVQRDIVELPPEQRFVDIDYETADPIQADPDELAEQS